MMSMVLKEMCMLVRDLKFCVYTLHGYNHVNWSSVAQSAKEEVGRGGGEGGVNVRCP